MSHYSMVLDGGPGPPFRRLARFITMNNQHFTAMASERRRNLLLSLQTESPQHLDLWMGGGSDRAIQLYHVHLPKLAEWGFIKWDRDDHQIARGGNYAELEPLLELLQADDSPPTP